MDTTTAPDTKYLTVPQVAETLHVSVRWVQSGAVCGVFEAYRILGRRDIRIPERAITQILKPIGKGAKETA